jgi:hypothetical protein
MSAPGPVSLHSFTVHSLYNSSTIPSLHPLYPLSTKVREQYNPWPFMSSTGQAASSTSSTSNIQLITNALAEYAKITGVDLYKNPFASAIEQSNSPEAILELLQEREKAFKEYRDNNRSLINCLSPAVKVIQAFSGILGEAVTLVSHKYHQMTLILTLVRFPSHQRRFYLLGSMFSSPYVPLICSSISSPVIYEFARPPVGSRQVTMPS